MVPSFPEGKPHRRQRANSPELMRSSSLPRSTSPHPNLFPLLVYCQSKPGNSTRVRFSFAFSGSMSEMEILHQPSNKSARLTVTRSYSTANRGVYERFRRRTAYPSVASSTRFVRRRSPTCALFSVARKFFVKSCCKWKSCAACDL